MEKGDVEMSVADATRRVEETIMAREIVRELTSHVRVSQRQIMWIIHELAMNLESREEMTRVTDLIRTLRPDLFFIDMVDGRQGDDHGSLSS